MLLNLVRNTDNDDVTEALGRIIKLFGPQLMPYAVEVGTELVRVSLSARLPFATRQRPLTHTDIVRLSCSFLCIFLT